MRGTLVTLGAVLLVAGSAGAAWSTWTGADAATNIYWNNGLNWDGGQPGWLDEALFPASAPTQMTVDMNGAWVNGITKLWFETSGYQVIDTVGGGGIRFDNDDEQEATDDIISKGAGTNEFGALFNIGSAAGTKMFYTETGNHMWFSDFGGAQAFTVYGGGTMVIGGTDDTNRNWNAMYTIGDANTTVLFNKIAAINNSWDTGTIGGSGGVITYGNSGTTSFNSGITFAPGGDGSTAGGDEIGTFTFLSYDLEGTGRWNVNLNSGSVTEMQLGTDGTADKVVLALTKEQTSGDLSIDSGATLALTGTTVLPGTYTLFENFYTTAPDITGTFGTVTYNGGALPASWTLHYNGDSITLEVPEPATMGLLAIGGAALLARRRSR